MVDYKKEVVKLLRLVFGETSVFARYPNTTPPSRFPIIVYEEEDNAPYSETTAGEVQTLLAYRFDLWGRESLTPKKLKVDEVMQAHGFRRVFCRDIHTEELRHVVMRYECVIDTNYKRIYKT